jgi:hypothetical protein
MQGTMTMQWIAERNAEVEERHDDGHFKTREDFLRLFAQLDAGMVDQMTSLARELASVGGPVKSDQWQKRAGQIAARRFDAAMLSTTVCAWALAKVPHLSVWLKVRQIARESWEIEHWLHEAMAAQVQRDEAAGKAYTTLAIELFRALEDGSLKSDTGRHNEARDRNRARWKVTNDRLDELWWGLHNEDFMSYEDEMRVLGLLADIAPVEFQQLIGGSCDPFLVEAALLGSGVGAFSPRFSQWAACVKAAPPAFAQDGRWTGSVVLPLLLVHARNHLQAPSRQIPQFGADAAEVAVLTAQVRQLIQAVIETIRTREDAQPAFARWSTWLMRQMLAAKESEFDDIRSHGFVDGALLEAIGKVIDGQNLVSTAPADAPPWEVWCYYCVRASLAHDRVIKPPSFEEFAGQWKLAPEDWRQPRGRDLLEKAGLHIPRDDMLSTSMQLLALPLANTPEFAKEWQRLWENAYYLREVLEFGSEDAGSNARKDSSDASRLLLVLVGVGLACFDQVATRVEASTERSSDGMADLHGAVAAAVKEVLHIDDTIYRGRWRVMFQHVGLRRAYWDAKFGVKREVDIFTTQDTSPMHDYLSYLQGDPGDLVALLHACLLNKLDVDALRAELRASSVDLVACIEVLKRLNSLRDRAYPISPAGIHAIQVLIN